MKKSFHQESAQLLSGQSVAKTLLSCMIKGTIYESPNAALAVYNLTPYEGCLELTCLNLNRLLEKCPKISTMSVSPEHAYIHTSQTTVAGYLLDADTSANHYNLKHIQIEHQMFNIML